MSETNILELAKPSRLELPPGDYGVQDIVEADVNLMDRTSDGLTVSLWLVKATSSLYVTVEDRKGLEDGELPEQKSIAVPEGHNPLDSDRGIFYHPMSRLEV